MTTTQLVALSISLTRYHPSQLFGYYRGPADPFPAVDSNLTWAVGEYLIFDSSLVFF